MEDLAPEFKMIGLIFLVTGPIQFILSFWLARNPAFPSWIGATLRLTGIALTLAGGVYYFQPWGIEVAQHVGGLIFMIALAFIVIRFRRDRSSARKKSSQ
jgi:uncharacterized membrane protein SirB2